MIRHLASTHPLRASGGNALPRHALVGIDLVQPHSRRREPLGGPRAMFLPKTSLRAAADGHRVVCPLAAMVRLNPLASGARRTAQLLLDCQAPGEEPALLELAARVSLSRQGLLPGDDGKVRDLLAQAGRRSLGELWHNRASRLLPVRTPAEAAPDIGAWLAWIASDLVVARVIPRAAGPGESGAIKSNAFLSVFPEDDGRAFAAAGTDEWSALTRDRLESLVWEGSLTSLAARFGVTRTTVARACRRWNIETPAPAYWQSRAALDRWKRSTR